MGDGADYLESQCDGGAEDYIRDQAEMSGHWVGQDGTEYLVEKMSDSHINNCINHLRRKECMNEDEEIWVDEWIDTFFDTLSSRSKSGTQITDSDSCSNNLVDLYKERYIVAQAAKVGTDIHCPVCNKLHIKTTYHKIFDKNGKKQKGGNCKDKYWNTVDPKRRQRAIAHRQR